jgi:cytochrome b561
VAQVALGFLLRWAQGEPLTFFGLLSMPTLVTLDHGFARTLGGLHDNVAWAIIIIAGLHAGAALLHHYVLRDDVLLRMMPAKG